MINLDDLFPTELQALFKDAQTALEQKQSAMCKEVVAQIKELSLCNFTP